MPSNFSWARTKRTETRGFFMTEAATGEDCECVICQEECVADADETTCITIECGHRFHCKCLLHWTRMGHMSCPLCRRSTAVERPFNALGFMTVQARAAHLRRTLGRRTTCPHELKRLLQNEKKARERVTAARRALAAYRRDHSAVLRAERRLRAQMYRARFALNSWGRIIGVFQHPDCPLPDIVGYDGASLW